MGAKIYDSTSASWKDANTPKIYNGTTFVDSIGKVYDSSTQSWKDAWGRIYYFVENSTWNFNNAFTTFAFGDTPLSTNTISGNVIYITTTSVQNKTAHLVLTTPFNFSGYRYINYDITISNNGTASSQGDRWGCNFSIRDATDGSYNVLKMLYTYDTVAVANRKPTELPNTTVQSIDMKYSVDISDINASGYLAWTGVQTSHTIRNLSVSSGVPNGYTLVTT